MASHIPNFCSPGNVSPKKLSGLPCLGIKSFAELVCVSPSLHKRSSRVVSQAFGRVDKTHLFLRHSHLSTRTGRSSKPFYTHFSSSRKSKGVARIISGCVPLSNSTKSMCFSAEISIRTSYLRSLRPCQAKGQDSEGSLSSESVTLDAEALEKDLCIAIAEENYAEAAKIRDSLKLLNEDRKTSVLAANARFYNAFRNGDLASMQTLWAKGEEVCCAHPGTRGISGYDDVMTSWEYVWANYEFPLDIELKDVKVHVRGDMGYVTCVELVRTKGSSWGGQFVTNVFERIDDQWFISIHQASPIDL